MATESVFKVLNSVDISGRLEVKNKFNYLPWSSAWEMVLERYPKATYNVVKDVNGNIYHTDGNTCWVETQVTIEDVTRNEILPVLDFRNAPIPLDKVNSFNVNNSIKRCFVKNLALFGLGLSLWNGEELSDNAKISKAKNDESLAEMQKSIVDICTKLVESGVDKTGLYSIIETYNNGNKNPRAIKSIDVATAIIDKLNELES